MSMLFSVRRCFLIAIIFLLSTAMLTAQVRIKEKVEIQPKAINLQTVSLGTSGGNTDKMINIQWTLNGPQARVYLTRSVLGEGCSNELIYGGTGTSIDRPLSAGDYVFSFGVEVATIMYPQTITYSFKVSIDGAVIGECTGEATSNGWAIYYGAGDITYNSPYATAFDLSRGYQLSMFYEEQKCISFRAISNCEIGIYDSKNDIIQMNITGGNSYAQFYNYNTGQFMGSSISGLINDLNNNYSIVANKSLPDASGSDVQVQVTSGSIDKSFTMKVKPYYFKVTANPERVKYGETAVINIVTVDATGALYNRPASPVVYMLLTDNNDYGTLLGKNGSSYIQSDYLPDIESDFVNDPNSGTSITFLANEKDSASVMTVGMLVEKTGEGGSVNNWPPYVWPQPGTDAVTGIGQVVVTKKSLISLTTSDTILKPLGDKDNKGPKNAKVIDFSKVCSTTVTVTVKIPNGDPVPDYPFTLSAYVRPNSGGHDHDDNRPTGKFIHLTDTVRTFSDKTGSDGTAKYKYLCSGFGGIDSLYVKGTTDQDTAAAKILIKIDKLVELTKGDHYVLVGMYGTGNVTSKHVKNHFGTQTTISRLKALADSAYNKESWVLQYNDIGLIYGGPFDIRNIWNTPHQKHREGKSIDMRPTSTDGTEISKEWLERIIVRQWKGRVSEEDTTTSNHHFHLTF